MFWVVGLVVLPLVVSAAVVIIEGTDYRPISDYALTELQIRDIPRYAVLNGLYSRDDWRHPGPMLFYLLAPFYWAVNGASIGMNLGALGINAAAIGGIAVFCWRRGGTPMLMCALLGCALVMRTMGADFLYDPWNNYVVTLPYGLMLIATWALICGDRLALPVAVITASFLAQTHVGYVLLAAPLLVLGAVWLVVPVLRRRENRARRPAVLRTVALSAAIGLVLWLPPIIDALTNNPSNVSRLSGYFRTSDEAKHSLGEGWRIVVGQYTWPPEWLTYKRTLVVGYGESSFMVDSAIPWLLIPVVIAAVYLWRHRREDAPGARYLVVVLGVASLLGVLAIMQTLGAALDYRLRWTWMPPLVAFVIAAWSLWQLAVRRWPNVERRILVPGAIALIVVVSSVNVVTAATVPSPWDADSKVMAHIAPEVLKQINPDGNQVVLTDSLSDAAWYTRGLVLQLERAGVDVRVPADREALFGTHRVVQRDKPVQTVLLVLQGDDVARRLKDPMFHLIARWRPGPHSDFAEALRRREPLDRALRAGTLTQAEYSAKVAKVMKGPPHNPVSEDLGVFVDEGAARRIPRTTFGP